MRVNDLSKIAWPLNIRIKTKHTDFPLYLVFVSLLVVWVCMGDLFILILHEENVLLTLFPGRPGSLLFVSSPSVELVPSSTFPWPPLKVYPGGPALFHWHHKARS